MIFSIIYLLKQPSILGSTIIHNHANYPLMFYTHPFFLNTSTTLLLKISVLSFREGAQKNLLTLGPSCVSVKSFGHSLFSQGDLRLKQPIVAVWPFASLGLDLGMTIISSH